MPYAQLQSQLDTHDASQHIRLIKDYLAEPSNIESLLGTELSELIDTALKVNKEKAVGLFLQFDALDEKYESKSLMRLFLADPHTFSNTKKQTPFQAFLINRMVNHLKASPDTFLDNLDHLQKLSVVTFNEEYKSYTVPLEEVLKALVEKHHLTVKVEADFGNRVCYEQIKSDPFFLEAFSIIFKKDSPLLDDFINRYKPGNHFMKNQFLLRQAHLLKLDQLQALLSHPKHHIFFEKVFNRSGHSMIAKWPASHLNAVKEALLALPETSNEKKSFKVDCLQYLLKWVGNFRQDDNAWYRDNVEDILSTIHDCCPTVTEETTQQTLAKILSPHFDTYFRRHPLLIQAYLQKPDIWLSDLNTETDAIEHNSTLYFRVRNLLDNADLAGLKGLFQYSPVKTFLKQYNLLTLLKVRKDEEFNALISDETIQDVITGNNIQDAGLLKRQLNVVLTTPTLETKFNLSKEERLVSAIFDKKWDSKGIGFFGHKTPSNIKKMRSLLGGKLENISYPLSEGLYKQLVSIADDASKQTSCLCNTRDPEVQAFYSQIGDDQEDKVLSFQP